MLDAESDLWLPVTVSRCFAELPELMPDSERSTAGLGSSDFDPTEFEDDAAAVTEGKTLKEDVSGISICLARGSLDFPREVHGLTTGAGPEDTSRESSVCLLECGVKGTEDT